MSELIRIYLELMYSPVGSSLKTANFQLIEMSRKNLRNHFKKIRYTESLRMMLQ